jgi:hypothetical protein
MRILSSAEKCRGVAQRMFFTTCVAGSFSGIDFCLMSADGGHANPGEHSVATSLAANAI